MKRRKRNGYCSVFKQKDVDGVTHVYRHVILHIISGLGSIIPSTSYVQDQGYSVTCNL